MVFIYTLLCLQVYIYIYTRIHLHIQKCMYQIAYMYESMCVCLLLLMHMYTYIIYFFFYLFVWRVDTSGLQPRHCRGTAGTDSEMIRGVRASSMRIESAWPPGHQGQLPGLSRWSMGYVSDVLWFFRDSCSIYSRMAIHLYLLLHISRSRSMSASASASTSLRLH